LNTRPRIVTAFASVSIRVNVTGPRLVNVYDPLNPVADPVAERLVPVAPVRSRLRVSPGGVSGGPPLALIVVPVGGGETLNVSAPDPPVRFRADSFARVIAWSAVPPSGRRSATWHSR
jgi:hypothetical protein